MADTLWTVDEYRGPEGLAALEGDWRQLYLEMPDPAMWHSHEAYSAYVEHLCPSPAEFCCFALSDDERVRAILPLEKRADGSFVAPFWRSPLRVWAMPYCDGWTISDAIGPEDDARRRLIPAVVERLRQDRHGPAVVFLGRTRSASVLWDGLGALDPRSRVAFPDGGEFVIPTDMPFDAFKKRLSRNSRSIFSRAARKFEALDGATYVRAVTQDDLLAEYQWLLDVEASGWKGRHGSSIRQQPGLEAFYRDLIERLTLDGRCEIVSLHAEGRCLASAFCVYTRHMGALFKCGYDEAYARITPGRLLTHKAVEWACDDPDTDSMSLCSDAPWARHWIPSVNGLRRAYVALRPVSGPLLLAALRFRYGPVRRVARAYKAWRLDHDTRTGGRRGRDAVSLGIDRDTRRGAARR
jgi:hypothetical protein